LRINGAMKKNPKKNEKLEKKEMTKGSSPLNKNKDFQEREGNHGGFKRKNS